MQWRVKSQSGQAAIEYILLLIISVALVLTLMTQFFKPLQTFISAYMGDYTACLLRTGELPSLGDSDSKSALGDQGCSAQFQPATLTGGRPYSGSGGGAASSSTAAKDTSSKNNGAGSGGASNGGGPNGNNFGSLRSTRSGDAAGASKKVVEIPVEGSSSNGFFKTSSGGAVTYRPPKTMSVGLTGMTESEKKKLEKKAEGPTRVIASDGPGIPPKKNTVKKPEKTLDVVTEEEPFTIGNFMRMLFIIAIILAIVIFVGGQVLQMSKSYDK